MRLPSLADRVLAALPGFTDAPMARDMAARLNTDEPHVRQAFDRLEKEGRAKIVRRGKGLHLVPADYAGLICLNCRAEFTRGKKSKRTSCSQSCCIAQSWKDPKTHAKRKAGIAKDKEARSTRAREANEKRWAQPGEREKLSELNRKRWADPYQNAKQSVAISKSRTPEARAAISERMKARWADKAGREKLVGGIRKSKQTPEARAKFSALLTERWQDPVWREKWTAANREKNRRKSEAAKAKREAKA